MKKLMLVILSAFLSVGTAFAQSPASHTGQSGDLPRPSLRLSLGGALPVGEFSSKDANSKTFGLAKPGGLAWSL